MCTLQDGCIQSRFQDDVTSNARYISGNPPGIQGHSRGSSACNTMQFKLLSAILTYELPLLLLPSPAENRGQWQSPCLLMTHDGPGLRRTGDGELQA